MCFDVQAATWDDEGRIIRARMIADQIARAVEIREEDSALEFGCGTGLISFNLCDKLKNITCIDTSPGMINEVNAKIQEHNVKNIAAFQQDINNSSIQEAEYNVIYTSMALHHIADIETTLAALYRMLKTDGWLCIVDLDEDNGDFHKLEKDFKGHNGFNQKKLKKVLEKIGFERLESHTFYNDKRMIEGVNVDYSLFIMKGKK